MPSRMAASVSVAAFSIDARDEPGRAISRTVRPSALEPLEAPLLVLEAALLQQLELRVLGVGGLLPAALGHFQGERREVVAAEEPHEVVGADDQAAVESLHRAPASEAGVRPPADGLTCTAMRSFISQLRASARVSPAEAKMLSDNGLRGLMRTIQASWVSRFRTASAAGSDGLLWPEPSASP